LFQKKRGFFLFQRHIPQPYSKQPGEKEVSFLKAQQKLVQDIMKGKQSTIHRALGVGKSLSMFVLSFNVRGRVAGAWK
jgi:hypothetical protein